MESEDFQIVYDENPNGLENNELWFRVYEKEMEVEIMGQDEGDIGHQIFGKLKFEDRDNFELMVMGIKLIRKARHFEE